MAGLWLDRPLAACVFAFILAADLAAAASSARKLILFLLQIC